MKALPPPRITDRSQCSLWSTEFWSTIRARQCLRWLDRFAPKGLQGNRPAHATSGIWWNLSQLMEAAHYDQNELSGLVTDVCKCYNTLPRAVVYAIGRHCGLPEVFMRSWHMAVAGITRHFIVGGACSFDIQSCTGYPEGDPLSVVSMVLINIAMHHIVEKQAAPTNTISFVDSLGVSFFFYPGKPVPPLLPLTSFPR